MEWVKLGDVTSIAMGKTPSRSNYDYWDGDNTWVSIADLKEKYIYDSKEKITENAVKESKIKLVPENTVIMSFKLSIGKVAITKIPLYTNEAIAHFLPKEDIIPEYLYYALQSIDYNKYVDKAVKGKTLNLKKLNNIEVPICSLDEQKYYSKLFNYLENLIQTRQDQIQALDDLVNSVFDQMFGSTRTNKTTLKKLIKFNNKNINDFENYSDFYYLGVEDIEKDTGNITSKVKVSEVEIKSSKKFFSDENVLYSRIRPNLNKVALPDFSGLISTEVYVLECGKDINKYFLTHVLRSNKFVAYAMLNSTGANFPRVSQQAIESYSLYLPPIEKQNQFAAFVEKIEKQKQILNDSLGELSDLFDSLMQDAFDGSMTK